MGQRCSSRTDLAMRDPDSVFIDMVAEPDNDGYFIHTVRTRSDDLLQVATADGDVYELRLEPSNGTTKD